MKFKNLYTNNKNAVQKALTSIWCGEVCGESQQAYAEALREQIEGIFTPEHAMPIVQCMNTYEPATPEERNEANANYIANLWSLEVLPFKHQYKAWKALNERTPDEQSKSIVVTTGTGSGKTECFMLPLIKDLAENNHSGIQAIFLYPLNALMEDQKERLNRFLETIRVQQNIDLKFAVYNGNLPERELNDNAAQIEAERKKYNHIIATRDEMRRNPPAIILTNPTMLEYMLLRNSDQGMVNQSEHLRWIVIDETHTYTGAAATELAMLMRRVIIAFNANADNIRFATASATLGNSNDSDAKLQLQQFISDISGQALNRIEVIEGQRQFSESQFNDDEMADCFQRLSNHEYLPLNEAITDGTTIEDKLSKLDDYCEHGLKAKVHFFHQVPNTGIKAHLSNYGTGHFQLHSLLPTDDSSTNPYLDLFRCPNCGEYIAIGEKTTDGLFGKIQLTNSNIFDAHKAQHQLIFGLSKDKQPEPGDGNCAVRIENNHYTTCDFENGQWNILMNNACSCPLCGQSFTDSNQQANGHINSSLIQPLRISSDFASRIISSSLLLETTSTPNQGLPFDGRKYLSFVDSRQSAAKSTLKQNLDIERQWVYSRIYNHLNRLAQTNISGMSWQEILDMLTATPEAKWLCLQFSKRTGEDEINPTTQQPYDKTIHTYINAVMVELLGRHPALAASPENMGLFTSYYPALERLQPFDQRDRQDFTKNVIDTLNNQIADEANKISFEDWKSLLKIVLDWNIRSNESVFLKTQSFPSLTISRDYQRFQADKIHTRPFQKPSANGQNLIVKSLNHFGITDTDTITSVIDAIEADLRVCGLLQKENPIDNDEHNIRLNLYDLGFKLYDKVWLCNASRQGKKGTKLRPVDTLFKGFSPWLVDNKLQSPCTECEQWQPYDYLFDPNNAPATPPSIQEIHEWAEENRSLLWNNGLWGEDGLFSSQLDTIHQFPSIYIQAEHTAQIDKTIAKLSQEDFKCGKINILACSTTMEMGVDIGDLEIVLLNSIPNSPASYKQRAGRSGRSKDMHKSTCITLCGTDSIGLRTLKDPIGTLISRVVAIPQVDLENRNVIQRHVNAFLLRKSGTLQQGQQNALNQHVIDFFTPFHFMNNEAAPTQLDLTRAYDQNNTVVDPTQQLGDVESTSYQQFIDYLDNFNDYGSIANLVRNTILERQERANIIEDTRSNIQKRYDELNERLSDIAATYVTPNLPEAYKRLLRFKFNEILAKNLLTFLANSRFSPNANMPVNIVQFDINYNTIGSNPSYPIQEALSQYTPGNTVILSNRAIIVKGILFNGFYRHLNTFEQLYTDGQTITVDNTSLANQINWSVNGKHALELIKPYAFTPEKGIKPTRILDTNTYTHVEAMFIDTTPWNTPDRHLMSIRTNKDTGNSKILYYNAGIGYGFCVCTKCGRTVIERSAAAQGQDIPVDLNPEKDNNDIPYHNHPQKGTKCCTLNQQMGKNTSLRRHVILGDYILTDFAEIRIRRACNQEWLTNNDSNLKILMTLGIVISRSTAEYIGIEPRDINFMITRTGSICIYDTNQGGSGYSNKLGNTEFLNSVIDTTARILNNCTSKEELLDKFTLRFIDDIDIEQARQWINDEIALRDAAPESISRIYPNARKSKFSQLIESCRNGGEIYLFTNDNWYAWNYKENGSEGNFKQRMYPIRLNGQSIHIRIIERDINRIPIPVRMDINEMRDWVTDIQLISQNFLDTSLYPLVMIGSRLWFTTNPQSANLSNNWGNEDVFFVDLQEIPQLPAATDIPRELPVPSKKTILESDQHISSCTLPQLVQEKCSDLVQRFKTIVDNAEENATIRIKCQDEHIKTVFAMVMNIQFIEYFAHFFEREFSVEFIVEEYTASGDNPDFFKQLTQSNRDTRLSKLLEEWEDSTDDCTSVSVTVKPPKALPHWREIKFEICHADGRSGGALVFYPNGGVHNEWYWERNREPQQIWYGYNDTELFTNDIPIHNSQQVMYDIVLDIP